MKIWLIQKVEILQKFVAFSEYMNFSYSVFIHFCIIYFWEDKN